MSAGMSEKAISQHKRSGVKKVLRRLQDMGIAAVNKGTYLEWRGPKGSFSFGYRILRASNGEVAGLPTLITEIDGQKKVFEFFDQGMEYLKANLGGINRSEVALPTIPEGCQADSPV